MINHIAFENFPIFSYKSKTQTSISDTTTAAGRGIYELVWDGLAYLDTRSEFWRQQKPLYARKRDKAVRNRAASGLRGASPQDYIITELEKIDEGIYLYVWSTVVT